MKPKRVLVCRATPVSPDPRVEKISQALANAGYQVTVLGWDMSGNYPLKDDLKGIPVYRCRLKIQAKKGLGNLPYQVRWQTVLFLWLARRRKEYDLIHACDFDTVLPALLCQSFFRKKVVYDIFDSYADMLRSTPEWIKSIIRLIDRWAIGKVDALILADAARIYQIGAAHPKRCAVILNTPEDWGGKLKVKIARPTGRGQLRLAYVGNLQIERGLLLLLQVLGVHKDWFLDLAGYGGDEGQILSAAGSLSNVTWHGRVPYETAMRINASADALIATYDPKIPNHRFSSPNKVYEAMMLGKPIIAARGTNMDLLIEQVNCGLVVEYGDREDLERAIRLLAEDSKLRHELGGNGRRAYEAAYRWAEMEQRLLGLYQEVAA